MHDEYDEKSPLDEFGEDLNSTAQNVGSMVQQGRKAVNDVRDYLNSRDNKSGPDANNKGDPNGSQVDNQTSKEAAENVEVVEVEEAAELEAVPEEEDLQTGWTAELTSYLPAAVVTATFDSESGIPRNAELVVNMITSGAAYEEYLRNAKDFLDDEELQNLFLLEISIMADGIDYADSGIYKIDVVLNESVSDGDHTVQAMKFNSDEATILETEMDTKEGEEHITFLP